ncbi:transmembrane protein 256-like [Colletes gigas]|uniref:transmembrane protein 256-like n=1 Tax=Colletes gigas TaxID=935657 RepID=UPI001C9A6C6C|nr:transmembrane protein 256-like [Colletes gigas]XP_043255680.1 transmembrane protein 256-like [Colletes gigas]
MYSLQDTLQLSSQVIYAAKYVWQSIPPLRSVALSTPKQETENMLPLWKLATIRPHMCFAGISGASAVIIGAYFAHNKYPEGSNGKKEVVETANRYHFFHSLALLGLPLCRKPFVTGTFLISGIVLFCGTNYYSAHTGDKQFNKVIPIGGVCFILGWLSMCL